MRRLLVAFFLLAAADPWALWKSGKMEESLAAFREQLAAARAAHNRRLEARTVNSIGLWHQIMGEYAEARRNYDEALRLARAVGDRQTEGFALDHIAWVHFVEHDYRGAIPWYERSLAVHRAAGDRDGEAFTLAGLGMTCNSLAEWARALDYERQALALVQNRRVEADILDHTGRALLGSGRAAEAEAMHRRALALRKEIGDRAGQTFPLSALAYAQRAQGDVDGAIASMQEVIAIIEASREAIANSRLRQSMFAGRQGHYLHLVDLLMDAHRERDALEMSERARARVTLDEIRAQGGLPPDTWPPLVEALDDETALLEYAEGEKRSFVWVMTTTSLESRVLASRAEIDAAALRLHALLASRDQRRVEHDLRAATAALSRMVLPPLALPPRIKRIVVVADGALQFIPFAMLGNKRPLLADYEVTAAPSASVVALLRKPRSGARGVAVVADPVFRADDSRVECGGHAAALCGEERRRGRRTPDRSAHDLGLKTLDRLPYTRAEADAIVRLARGASLKAVDFDASRRTVTAADFGGYRVLHFATHALLNTKHPELSGIVLSLVDRRGRPLDGFLSTSDIYALRLRSSLVVLSACRTALGKDVRGEGLVGLVRAFMYAGAPSVVASYWDVGDADTAEVMKRFYARLLEKQEKPSAALRHAQLSIATERGWRSPRAWAAFTLQGDWR